MNDQFGREINYLRISLTDNCNLRCIYCTPNLIHKNNILSFEDISKIIGVTKELGIKKIRLTGGEPLLRNDLNKIISKIKDTGINEIYLTTNGILLEEKIEELKEVGLCGVNISLDTLDGEIFKKITRGGDIQKVLRGIEKSLELGLKVKINSVIIKGINEKFEDLVRLTENKNIDVRFIELMPIGEGKNYQGIDNQEILESLKKSFEINEENFEINGVTRYFRIKNFKGRVGFISPIHNCFCETCNKIRITSSGEVKRCLNEKGKFNIKNIDEIEIKEILKNEIMSKPEKHLFGERKDDKEEKNMNEIGG